MVLSEEHECIIESNTQWIDDTVINASQYLLHSMVHGTQVKGGGGGEGGGGGQLVLRGGHNIL